MHLLAGRASDIQPLEGGSLPRLGSTDLHILTEIVSLAHQRTLSQRLHFEVRLQVPTVTHGAHEQLAQGKSIMCGLLSNVLLQQRCDWQTTVICSQVPLSHIFLAYKAVLPQHGITAAEDTYYYRLLIALSLRPESTWWAKLDAERQRTDIFSPPALPHHGRGQHGSPGPIAEAPHSVQHPGSPHGALHAVHDECDTPTRGPAIQRPEATASVPEWHTDSTTRLPAQSQQQWNATAAAATGKGDLHCGQLANRAQEHSEYRSSHGDTGPADTTFITPARHVQNDIQQHGRLRDARTSPATEQWQDIADRFLEGSQVQDIDRLSHDNPAERRAHPKALALTGDAEGVQAAPHHTCSSPGRQTVNGYAEVQGTLSDVPCSRNIRHSGSAIQAYSEEVSLPGSALNHQLYEQNTEYVLCYTPQPSPHQLRQKWQE